MEANRLPLPSFISSSSNTDSSSNPTSQDGNNIRIRSYPHVRGQWTTFIYADVPEDSICHLFDSISGNFHQDIKPIEEVHLSMVRGHYSLTFHQISTFLSTLRERLSSMYAFDVYLSTVKLFHNQESTRSFVCLCEPKLTLDTSINSRSARKLLQVIASTLDLFHARIELQQPLGNQGDVNCNAGDSENYDGSSEDFIFHTSIAWCLPAQRDQARKLVESLDDLLDEPIKIHVRELKVTIGNTIHTITLKEIP